MLQADPGGRRGSTVLDLTGRMEVNVTNSDVDGVVFTLLAPLEITGMVRADSGDLESILTPPARETIRRNAAPVQAYVGKYRGKPLGGFHTS